MLNRSNNSQKLQNSNGTSQTVEVKATIGGDETIPIKIDSAGNAIVDVNWWYIANELDNNSGNPLVLNIPSIGDVSSYIVELPGNYFQADTTEQNNFIIVTDNGTINISSDMLSNQPIVTDHKIGINIRQVGKAAMPDDIASKLGDRPLISLALTIDGQKQNWNNPDSPVTVSIPYTPLPGEDLEHIVVWYIDGSGNIVEVPSGKYDPVTGTVTFQTTHFSNYAVAYVEKTFSDIKSVNWATNQIEVLASKGIILGTTETTYSPNINITRADYLLYLVNTLNLTADFDGNFSDIKSTDYYYEAIGIAKELGVTTGKGNNTFGANDKITRQDMMTLTVRALSIAEKLNSTSNSSILSKFKDNVEIADYAINSVATLVSEGLIIGSNNMINPNGNTTRAEAAVLLYRIYNKY